MADQNPFANAFSTPAAQVEGGDTPSTPSSNPFANAFTATSTATTPTNPFASAFGSSGTGQSAPTEHLYQDSSQPLYKRAWDFATTPLTESLFGLPETRPGAGGFERGLEKIASGFTSPLSVALTAATFGTGGAIASAGETALKESGEFAAEEIPQLVKGAQAAVQATKDLAPGETAVADAVKAAGVDPAKYAQAQRVLYNNGLTEADLTGGNALERGAFHIIRHVVPGTPVGVAAKMAKTANAVMNAGFTYQQLEAAAQASPRFLDALKSGDYDSAKEFGVEALAGSALGIAGAGHAIKSWGELAEPILSTKNRPSDTTVAVARAH